MKSKKLELKIMHVLNLIGIPVYLQGYRYLKEGLKQSIIDAMIIEDKIIDIQLFYQKIAELENTTTIKVERAIRHAIVFSWNQNLNTISTLYMRKYFETNIPSNKEFIIFTVDKLLLENLF